MSSLHHPPEREASSWFLPERQPALNDFWAVYDASYDASLETTTRLVREHPEFGPIMAAMSPEQIAAQNADSRDLLRRAVAGEWGAYEANLREQGAVYAKMGVSFAGWYDVVRAFHADLVPRLVEAYGAAPGRLTAALLALQDFVDKAMVIIAQAYLEAKEEALLRSRSDVVELERQNQRVNEANRLKSELLANMSHELRTPLNSIIGFAEVLHDGEVDPASPEHDEFLGDILKSGRHLLQLINDVLDLAKVEAGKLEFHPEPVSLGPLAGEVAAILRSVTAARGVRLQLDVGSLLGEVVVDPARLKQVLYNYLSNALKFTPPGGTVTVRAAPEGADAFRVEVEDTGIGIAPEDVRRLFVEFQQLDTGAAKKHGGTGLGLALTKRLVEAQGGSVGVRSAPGVGSVFHAILPRQAPAGVALPEPQVIAGARDAPRVLVIEDDPRDQRVIVRALAAAGYAVETAATGAQALARCREVRFDAVTLDLLLPDMSGLAVLAGIREQGCSAEARVIVVSVVAEKGAAGGFAVDDTLEKPVDEAALLASLRRVGVVAGKPGHVLVVDDDPGSLKLMQVTLSQLGYRVVCKPDGRSALEAAEEERPHAVILDLLMPRMDGFEFLVRFRAREENRRVPVIVWTMKDLSDEEQARLRASAQAVLLKGRDGAGALVEELSGLRSPPGTRAARAEAGRGR